MTADPPPPATPAILLSREQAAAALSISTAHLDRLERRGLIGPQAIRLGERLAYGRDQLERWAAAGCPPRVQWARMTEADGPIPFNGRGAA